MKKIFIFFAIFLVSSVNFFAQSAIAKSDYEIYAEVLKDLRRRDVKNSKIKFSFVILSATYANLATFDDFRGKKYRGLLREYNGRKYRGLSRDFRRKNRVPLTFRKIFPVKYKYYLAGKSEIEKLFDKGKKELERLRAEYFRSREKGRPAWWYQTHWKYFDEKYPKSKGYYKFSRIGYSLNKRFALVTTEGTGLSWSNDIEYLFEKIGNKWTIVQSGGNFFVD